MTPKEQAEKLYGDYERYIPDGDWDTVGLAKKLALIAVYEIKKNVTDIVQSGFLSKRDVEKHLEWWTEVQDEIEKIHL